MPVPSNYEEFRGTIPGSTAPLMDYMRELCVSPGTDIVEDVRMHRVVFAKSFSFRWFADVKPDTDGITIKLQRGRKEPPQEIRISSITQADGITQEIQDAYENI